MAFAKDMAVPQAAALPKASPFTALWPFAALLGLAVLLPVVPFSLEMLALRRLSTAAFGTLMSLEPAFAMLVGLIVLAQVPGPLAVVGIAFVVDYHAHLA